MKKIIKELTEYKRIFKPNKYLSNTDKKMDFADLSNLIGWLLQWQKSIKHNKLPQRDYFFKDYYLLSNK